MNRAYNKEDKKDRFIGEHLLPYLLNRIRDSDDQETAADDVASMIIFPYKTANGTMLGSLKEPGIDWYFVKDKDKDNGESCLSTESYHIFDDSLLKKEQAIKFRQTFGEYNYISEFSDNVVINDLIEKMSKETDYTAQWWKCAYDVFEIWDPKKFNVNLSKATTRINNNYFLFLDRYCDKQLKKDLISCGIFRDVLTETAKNLFWNRIKISDKGKALSILQYMGVPHSFVKKTVHSYGILSQNGDAINPYILSFVKDVGRTVRFPVSEKDCNADKCNLCHRIVSERIFNESEEAFKIAVKVKENAAGMLVKNIAGEFVPLSWDLFYSNSDFKDAANRDNGDSSDLADTKERETVALEYEDNFERLHVDVCLYRREFVEMLDHMHEFSSVNEISKEYYFGIEGDSFNFYKWIWKYSRHEKLIENVLRHFSRDEYDRNIVPDEHVPFILEVLNQPNTNDKGYRFDMDMEMSYVFENADIVNRIGRDFNDIYCVVYSEDCYEQLNVQEYIPQIIAATDSDHDVRSTIALDRIWDHVYLADVDKSQFDSRYVHAYISDGDDYEDALILWPSDTADSYIRALAKYVQETYRTSVSIVEKATVDWKAEYARLIQDIRCFVNEKRAIRSVDELNLSIAQMNDVKNFGDEKRIWLRLKEQHEEILSYCTDDVPGLDLGGRDFLSAKYHGRCQLCGGKIAMGEQNSYFWTFRIVKKSKNKLANIKSNLFCLCPSCHGEMRYGDYMGKDMSQIVEKAQIYAEYIDIMISSEELDDDSNCIVQELVKDDVELHGFYKPIICNVVVNGKHRKMAFSWEHFMRIAFVFASFNDVIEG